jgi:ABC-type transport system substrate-binding protein
MLGVLIAAAGCATSTASPPPASPSTPAAVTPNQLALATLNDIVQGDPAAATVSFDQTMRRLLSPDAIQRIRSDGQIAGLYFLKEGVPVP